MAIAATVYMDDMGGEGLQQLAELSVQRADPSVHRPHHLAAQLVERKGYRLLFDGSFLWEFVMHTPFLTEQNPAFVLGRCLEFSFVFFRFQAEDGIRDWSVTGVQTCALPISSRRRHTRLVSDWSSDVCSSDLKQKTAYEIGQ